MAEKIARKIDQPYMEFRGNKKCYGLSNEKYQLTSSDFELRIKLLEIAGALKLVGYAGIWKSDATINRLLVDLDNNTCSFYTRVFDFEKNDYKTTDIKIFHLDDKLSDLELEIANKVKTIDEYKKTFSKF